jgi:hypothetical protein
MHWGGSVGPWLRQVVGCYVLEGNAHLIGTVTVIVVESWSVTSDVRRRVVLMELKYCASELC